MFSFAATSTRPIKNHPVARFCQLASAWGRAAAKRVPAL